MESIHIKNCSDKISGWLEVQVSAETTLIFPEGINATVNHSPVGSSSWSLQPNISYLIDFAETFDCEIHFSKVTNLKRFNATIYSGKDYFGLLVDSKDLYKLSSVEFLGLRYSVCNVKSHATIDLRGFSSLCELYLGTSTMTSEFIDNVLLSDSTAAQLRTFNVGIRKLPSNLILMANCSGFYCYDVTSWENVEFEIKNNTDTDEDATINVNSFAVIDASIEYYAPALQFFYINRNKLRWGKEMPDFTLNEYFINANVGKLRDICRANLDDGLSLKIGPYNLSDNDDGTITVGSKGIYPKV